MEDITPKLLEHIQSDFQKKFDANNKIKKLYDMVKDGSATYKEANEFAIETGEILASVFKGNLSSDILPDGKLYYNIAERILTPTLENNHELVAEIASDIQANINKSFGIGIKAIKPELNQDKVKGIIDIVSGKDNYDDIAYMLGEPIVNFTQSVVDATVKVNADFQYKAGLSPKIRRTATSGCCEWCDKLNGVYDYADVSDTGNNVFRRHKHCRCLVEYDSGDGRRQNVHTKKWSKEDESDKIKERKKVGISTEKRKSPKDREKKINLDNGLGFAERIASHPKMFRAYTPMGLKKALENAGYDVQPLARGSLKGKTFEEGGGFRVNFGGDGLLQYHPESGSHHGGEYYKISTGEGGTKRYDRNGEEKND